MWQPPQNPTSDHLGPNLQLKSFCVTFKVQTITSGDEMGVPVKSFRLGPAQAWSVAGGRLPPPYNSWDGKGKAEMSAKNCRDLEGSLRRSNIPAWARQGRGILQQVW